MVLDHERLDVYGIALDFLARACGSSAKPSTEEARR
jgi:hypothetical protein